LWCGGLSEGFRQKGFEILLANDIDIHCKTTYKINHHIFSAYFFGESCYEPEYGKIWNLEFCASRQDGKQNL
jgi:site-specific DNA-cytosine methylase